MGEDIERIKAVTILAEEINKKRSALFIGAGCSIFCRIADLEGSYKWPIGKISY